MANLQKHVTSRKVFLYEILGIPNKKQKPVKLMTGFTQNNDN